MANITTNVSSDPQPGLWKRFFAALMHGIEAQSSIDARRRQIAALEAKSDEDLARMGLRREDIAYHVFKDLFYT